MLTDFDTVKARVNVIMFENTTLSYFSSCSTCNPFATKLLWLPSGKNVSVLAGTVMAQNEER